MPFLAINDDTGFQMHYEVRAGAVPRTTLFIHGNLSSTRWWAPSEKFWMEKYSTQKCAGDLIYADFRGCGKSSAPKSESEITMERLANDHISLVEGLNLKGGINLVGHSTGGLIAALMLARRPELFHRAVFLDPVGAQGVVFEPAMEQAFTAMKTDRQLTAAVIGSTIQGNDPENEFFRNTIVEDAQRAIVTVGSSILKALSNVDLRETLSKAQHPVLVLHGEKDVLLPMEESKKLAEVFSKGQFKVIPKQGHCTNVENPKLFVEMLNDFLF